MQAVWQAVGLGIGWMELVTLGEGVGERGGGEGHGCMSPYNPREKGWGAEVGRWGADQIK